MLSILPDNLILLIGGFCPVNNIYNLLQTCKYINNLRLYRFSIPYLICYRFTGKYCYNNFKNDLNDILIYFKNHNYDYTFVNFIDDIHITLFNTPTIHNDTYFYKKHKYNFKYKHSPLLLRILNGYKIKSNNGKNEIKYYDNCHHIYRVNLVVYNKLKNNKTILSLIY
jgi:hypothetical protein